MKKKHRLIFLSAVTFLIVAIGFWYYFETRPFQFKTSRSLRELSGISSPLSEQESSAVRSMLGQYYIETQKTAGFVHYSAPEDLQGLHTMFQFSKVFDEAEIREKLEEQLSQIRLPSPDTLDIVNLVYYAELGYEGIVPDFDAKRVLSLFSRFYDHEHHLFFLSDEKDIIHQKIALTAFCVEYVPALKDSEQFSFQEGAEQAMRTYQFDTNHSLAFFNAGGDILYLYHVLGLKCPEIVKQQADWFASWSELYATAELKDLNSLTAEHDYCSVAKMFGIAASNSRLLDFYDTLEEQQAAGMINSQLDALMFADAMRGIDTARNPSAKEAMAEKYREILQKELVFHAELSAEQTAYGVFLAESTGMALNRDKVNAFLKEEYEKLETQQNAVEQIEQLYYLIAIDGIMNQYTYMYSAKGYQQILDHIFAVADTKNSSAVMLNAERKAVEIIQNLQIHNVDVKLTKWQRNRLIRMLRTAVTSDERVTIGFTDILLLNDMLDADLVSLQDMQNVYHSLRTDDGIRAALDDTCTPDLYSIFLFGVCMTERNDFSKHDELCSFARIYRDKEGLFIAKKDSMPFPGSVYFGFWLEKQRIGGDK